MGMWIQKMTIGYTPLLWDQTKVNFRFSVPQKFKLTHKSKFLGSLGFIKDSTYPENPSNKAIFDPFWPIFDPWTPFHLK